ncbi:MAG: histone deacetylase family protein [Pseudomonadota bacterium]
MQLDYISHPDCVLHDASPHHPERPARIGAIEDHLTAQGMMDLFRHHTANEATREQLQRVHEVAHIERVLAFSEQPEAARDFLDPDTVIMSQTPRAALRAAGALAMAVDLVMQGETSRVFCGVRPPGHHAVRAQAMGFCFFNNVAVGAAHALEHYGLERIAICDFDVHHGNGTEAIFLDEPRVLFCSSFQYPFYPNTPVRRDRKHIISTPLPAGTAGPDFRTEIAQQWLPALRSFQPQLVFISAGFDAHAEDPLAEMLLQEEDYAWVTTELCGVANECAEGRIISTLEGGYSLSALGRSANAHLKALMEI